MRSSKSNVQAKEHPMRARSAARRSLLLDSIIELIAHEGVDAVTHRRVAAHANVPLGSTTYYFESRDRMLIDALDRFGRQEIAAIRQRLDEVSRGRPSRRRYVQLLVESIKPQLDEDRWRTIAQYTLMLEAARRPELAPVVRDWTAAWGAVVEKILTALGVAKPALGSTMLVAMLDGLLIQQLAAPSVDFVTDTLEPALTAMLMLDQHGR